MQRTKLTLLISMLSLSVALLSTGCKKAEEPAVAQDEQALEQTEGAAEANDEEAHDGHDHGEGDHAGHDHDGHDHGEGDHAGHDHDGHDHDDAAHAGHGHEGHDHDAADGDDIMDLVLKEGTFDEADVVRQPGAKIGDLVRCTVSGEAFIVTEGHSHVTHEGEEVYFCCPGCIRRFQRNPQPYIDGQK